MKYVHAGTGVSPPAPPSRQLMHMPLLGSVDPLAAIVREPEQGDKSYTAGAGKAVPL